MNDAAPDGNPLHIDPQDARHRGGRHGSQPGQELLDRFADQYRLFRSAAQSAVQVDLTGGAALTAPVSLIAAESVEALAAWSGHEGLDGRRFRMLIDLRGCRPHEEEGWIGRRVRVGEAVLRVVEPTARCGTTQRDPTTGLNDVDTLRAIKGYRGFRPGGRTLDLGVYATVETPGIVRVGDPVETL